MASISLNQLKDKFSDINIDYLMRTYGFPDATIKDWNLLKEYIASLGISILEFRADAPVNNHWAMMIEPTKPVKGSSGKFFNRRINEDLKVALSNRKNFEDDYLHHLFTRIKLSGFFIPLNNVNRIDFKTLRSHLTFSSLLIKHFDYQEYFSDLMRSQISLKANGDSAPHAIWNYILYYARFLQTLKGDNYGLYEIYSSWFTNLLDLENFHRRLPSEQLTILLLNMCESLISNEEHDWMGAQLHSKARDEVSEFFENNEHRLRQLLTPGLADSSEMSNDSSHQNLESEFVRILLLDHKELTIQEVFDNRNKLNLSLSLPVLTQIKYGLKSVYNMAVITKDKVLNSDEKSAGEFSEDDEVLPNYRRKKHKIYSQNFHYWYDLLAPEKNEIIAALKANLGTSEIEMAENVIKIRRQHHHANLMNLISAPVLYWKIEKNNFFPQWNLFEDNTIKNLLDIVRKKKEDGRKERRKLEKHLKEISELDTLDELKEYLKLNRPIFSNKNYQLKWEQEVERISRIIRNREKFYISRMEEFGISESTLSSRHKNIWIKEMLEVEDEVSPYIKYVKQAFQTALPIRKIVSFNQDRHSSDGVEFDPDTLFDQEKWIRANVMKVMQSKIERGEAIQINTFCLDYSGSMKHERMRNLFKILFLLVSGLEDRKSFDAFHFFSDKFIEVHDFTSEYTNRKVLFKIMRQIAQLHIGGVKYFGEGGTNMSEGIKMSHKKMLKFVKEFKAENPEANIVTSMFVITDGEPSLGITDIPKLNGLIEKLRQDGDVEIKGIFIKSEDDVTLELMDEIFGPEHFVETTDFHEGVNKFVEIMTETYKKQRKAFKWKQKRRKLGLTDSHGK